MFIEGKMRAIFSMLFGAPASSSSPSRAEKRGAADQIADIYCRRNLWLMLFGLLHACLVLVPGDILFGYGVTALLFLYPCCKLALPGRFEHSSPALLLR